MAELKTYTFESALALLKEADQKLLELERQYAAKNALGAPGIAFYRYEKPKTVEKVIQMLEKVAIEYERLQRALSGEDHQVSHEQTVQLSLLAERMGL